MYQELIAGLQGNDADAAAERKRTGREPLGAAAILRQHPHTRPDKTQKSPAPRFHAASKAVLEALRQAYGHFLRLVGTFGTYPRSMLCEPQGRLDRLKYATVDQKPIARNLVSLSDRSEGSPVIRTATTHSLGARAYVSN